MKSSPRLLSVAALSLALASCADVTSRQVIGDTPAKLDPKKWNGAWAGPRGAPFYARVKDPGKGALEVAWLDVRDEEIRMSKVDVTIRQAGGWLWASYREKETEFYTIARVSDAEDRIIAWTFQPGPIRKRVKAGELKGEILRNKEGEETKSVVLEVLHDADLQAIKEGRWGDVFDWGKPALQLFRVKD